MKILLIGGTGVLSSAVTAEALHQGIDVTMINRGNRTIPADVEHIKADKDEYEKIGKILQGRYFDAVMDFLLLSDNDTRKSVEFYTQFTKQYFYISSCAVYNTEKLAGKMGNEESSKVLPIWPYSVNKWASEQMVMRLFENKDVYYTVIRPCITYGNTRIPYGISPQYGYHWTLCARILNGKPIIRWNGGVNRCNMMRVEDFAIGVVGLIGNPKAHNEAFNICGDETPSFNDVLKVLSKLTCKDIKTVDISSEFYAKGIPNRAGEILGGRSIDSINSNEKIKSVVPSFKQTISLSEGIRMTYEAYKTQNYQKGIDWDFDADTDCIIKKWCKKNKIDSSQYKLGFVDYLGNATVGDKIQYYLSYHKERYDIRFVRFIIKACRKFKRIYCKVIKCMLDV